MASSPLTGDETLVISGADLGDDGTGAMDDASGSADIDMDMAV